ncbi:unnamed protein product [Penicillium olsonii]|nr:unnamed protein product [Penicillium olsonii]CAG7934349.1 unnamed protein product [Penicillium olsonii]
MWFWGTKRRLRDLQSFDSASRGPWGSSIILFEHKGNSIASIGALIIILTLAFDPFLQQVLTFPLRQTSGPSNLNPQDSSFNQVHDILPLWDPDPRPGYSYPTSKGRSEYVTNYEEAILSGIWSRQPQINPTCASANCTWEPFQSVGYCAQCADMTSSAEFIGSQSTKCSISLAQGLLYPLKMTFALSNNSDGYLYEQLLPASVIWKAYNNHQTYNSSESKFVPSFHFLGIENPLLVLGHAEINYDTKDRGLVPRPEQLQRKFGRVTGCVLSLCSRTYNISVKNGNPKVQVSSPDFGEIKIRLSQSSQYPPAQIIDPKGSAFCNVNSLTPDILQHVGGVIYNRFRVSDHQVYWKSSGYKNDLNSSGVFKCTMRLGLESMMHNIADSLANMALRESANLSHGTPHVSEVYVQVNWPWVALPATLIVSACVLLIITAHIARSQDRRLWKTSTLPIFYHGLDEDLLKDTEEYSTLSKMEATADSTTVGLGLSDTDGRVLLQR